MHTTGFLSKRQRRGFLRPRDGDIGAPTTPFRPPTDGRVPGPAVPRVGGDGVLEDDAGGVASWAWEEAGPREAFTPSSVERKIRPGFGDFPGHAVSAWTKAQSASP